MNVSNISPTEWGALNSATKKTINCVRRHYLLSSEEVDDCINSLVVEYAPRLVNYKPSVDGMSLETWLIDSMRRRVPRVVQDLRTAGMTGEIDGDLQLCDYWDFVPNPRGLGDAIYYDESQVGAARPQLADVLAHPQTTQTLDEATVDGLLSRLAPDEARLLTTYYGLNNTDPLTQLELALLNGVSQQAIQLRLRGIVEKLRRSLYKEQPQGSIKGQRETINATVRKLRRAEHATDGDPELQGMRARDAVSRRWSPDVAVAVDGGP